MIQDFKKNFKILIFNINSNCTEWYMEYYYLFRIAIVLI